MNLINKILAGSSAIIVLIQLLMLLIAVGIGIYLGFRVLFIEPIKEKNKKVYLPIKDHIKYSLLYGLLPGVFFGFISFYLEIIKIGLGIVLVVMSFIIPFLLMTSWSRNRKEAYEKRFLYPIAPKLRWLSGFEKSDLIIFEKYLEGYYDENYEYHIPNIKKLEQTLKDPENTENIPDNDYIEQVQRLTHTVLAYKLKNSIL